MYLLNLKILLTLVISLSVVISLPYYNNQISDEEINSADENNHQLFRQLFSDIPFVWRIGPVSNSANCNRHCQLSPQRRHQNDQCIIRGFRVQGNFCLCHCLPNLNPDTGDHDRSHLMWDAQFNKLR